jgi:hypothetical protein
VEDLPDIPGYADLLRQLAAPGGGPPVVRVGGGSTDLQRFVPDDRVWDALNRLHAATGVKYIIGLNLEAGDPQLSKRQMQAAEAKLTPGSVLSFEIGNEVRVFGFFLGGGGGSSKDPCNACKLCPQQHHPTLNTPTPPNTSSFLLPPLQSQTFMKIKRGNR